MSTELCRTSRGGALQPTLDQRHLSACNRTSGKQGLEPLAGPRARDNRRRKAPVAIAAKSAWHLLDLVIGMSCGVLVAFVHHSYQFPYVTMAGLGHNPHAYLLAAILFSTAISVLSRLAGLQSFEDRRSALAEIAMIGQIATVAAFGVYGMLRFWHVTGTPRHVLPAAVILTTAAMVISRVIWRHHRHHRFQHEASERSVLIAGTDSLGAEVRDYFSSLHHSGIRFLGFVTLDEESDDTSVAREGEILGSVQDVIAIARSHFADEIIFSRRPATTGVLSDTLNQARSMGIDIRLIPSLTETLKNRPDVQYIGALPTIAIHQRELRTCSLLLKRTLDICGASAGLLLLAPLLAILAAAVKLQSRGPVFYLSKRVGYKGYVFTCYKFRTMFQNADAMRSQLAHLNEREGVLFKITNDPRVTAVGAILRKYSLDELPQLWNVLKGDMSLVGPRPSISSEVAQYKTEDMRRLDVVPGITGLWQVEARSDPSFQSYITLDSTYVSNWSLLLDLRILCKTVRAVFLGTGT